MIKTVSFVSSNLESVSNNINEWIKKGTERYGAKFKLALGNCSTILKAVARLSQFIRNMLITVILFPFV
jgi:hypothetical protein